MNARPVPGASDIEKLKAGSSLVYTVACKYVLLDKYQSLTHCHPLEGAYAFRFAFFLHLI
jgi:hypothetical protein